MSTDVTPVELPGSLIDDQPFRHCSRCECDRSPAGGLQTHPKRWICGKCWRHRLNVAMNPARAA